MLIFLIYLLFYIIFTFISVIALVIFIFFSTCFHCFSLFYVCTAFCNSKVIIYYLSYYYMCMFLLVFNVNRYAFDSVCVCVWVVWFYWVAKHFDTLFWKLNIIVDSIPKTLKKIPLLLVWIGAIWKTESLRRDRFQHKDIQFIKA